MPRKPSRKFLDRQTRVGIILPILRKLYPAAKCSLDFKTPLQLLVATMLSAQCTDERVNLTTPALFKRYRSAPDFAGADSAELEKIIQSTGFFRSKAKSIRGMATSLVQEHQGQVPRTMEQLTALAGVGRKTANVVLGNAFDLNEGVVVDTHVTRVSNRLNLTDHVTDAVKIEQDLIPLVPKEEWTLWSHLLIFHGRTICTARNPKCERCPLLKYCPFGQKVMEKREKEALAAARKAKPIAAMRRGAEQ